jgi:CheY-like chemotaxis protein
MAMNDAPAGSKFSKDLDKVLQAAHRAKGLVQQILAFSRQSQAERLSLKPASIVKEALKMLRASIPTTIEIQENIEGDCGSIEADPTQIHQILMNLCTNAFHAMEERGGVLQVALRKTASVPAILREGRDDAKENFIHLSVSDTGTGIAPEVLDKIFDPFFTTKEKGKGTGMGLAITYGIVKDHGGAITVDSRLGQGTTFHVYLPQSKNEGAPRVIEDKDILPTGTERILFVDDEDLLAEIGKDMLERLGYQVTVKQRSFEALEVFQNQPDQFDIVITDQTMPGMTGLDLARRMIQIRPDIPIILCTGYSHLVNEEIAKAQGIKEFALKPMTKSSMAKLIRKVLGNQL